MKDTRSHSVDYIDILIERDKVKPKRYDSAGWPHCQSCNSVIGDGNFCRYCGQRLKNGSK